MRFKPGAKQPWYNPVNYHITRFQYWPCFEIKAKPIIILPRKIKIKSKICFRFCVDSISNFIPFIEDKINKILKEEVQDLWMIDEDLALFEEDL